MAPPLLLSCGRVAALKTFHLQTLGLRNLPAAVSLCTTSGDSKKGSTKNEGDTLNNNKPGAAVKLTNEDLRKFLARKTLVTFPQRTTFPSLERESVFSSTEGLCTKVTDRDSSSSSSSESDSSSDSEEEDSAFKYTVKTKVLFPRRDPVISEDRAELQTIRDTQFSQEEVRGETPEKLPQSPTVLGSPVRHKEMCQTAVDDTLLFDKSDLKSLTQSPKEAHLKRTGHLGMKIAEGQSPTKATSKPMVAASLPEGSSSMRCSTQSVPESVAQNLNLPGQETGLAKEPQRTEVQRSPADIVLQEEKWDGRMPVTESTENVEVVPEAGTEIEPESTIQEAKPAAEAAPEPFDISSYKNLQHHEYTPYTFVDYDVQLSKLRLPQPSSGRLSPRH